MGFRCHKGSDKIIPSSSYLNWIFSIWSSCRMLAQLSPVSRFHFCSFCDVPVIYLCIVIVVSIMDVTAESLLQAGISRWWKITIAGRCKTKDFAIAQNPFRDDHHLRISSLGCRQSSFLLFPHFFFVRTVLLSSVEATIKWWLTSRRRASS